MSDLTPSFAAGYACLSAWADLLDRINVFPVADGDTGTNLRISLAPLRDGDRQSKTVIDLLARSATGNSGNIAAAFFREFCQVNNYSELADKAGSGNEKAWQAIASPRAGTMLSVFDSLAQGLSPRFELDAIYSPLRLRLQKAVQDTSRLLPELENAGVVDSGALAMYIFFDGFFRHLTRQTGKPESILDLFTGKLAINSSFRPQATDCYCVDMIIEPSEHHAFVKGSIAELGESVVVVEDETMLKVHLHTPDPKQLRGQLGVFGDIVHWSAEEIDQGTERHYAEPVEKMALHIVGDAAGSITREMARKDGITLLDSYIIEGDSSRPESLHGPAQLYSLMRQGRKVTTAQASTFERHQHYESICQQFGRSLYLVVGSAYTGNFETVMAWKKDNDPENLLTVIDTGAASGRLGLITLLTARSAKNTTRPEEVIEFAEKAIADCVELVFIDELKYLVAGGRVSRASGFFGDLLSMKPVISPTKSGVRKVGVVHSRKGQLAFALEKLAERFGREDGPVIMLQYSDNTEWVSGVVLQKVKSLLPQAEILLTPLSLTSGVHMGPGTWSMAFCSAKNVSGKISD
jgi:DegV family protein with EDD domain